MPIKVTIGNDYYAMMNWLDLHCQGQYHVSRGPHQDDANVKFENVSDADFFILKWNCV